MIHLMLYDLRRKAGKPLLLPLELPIAIRHLDPRMPPDRAHAIELGEDENFVCDLIGLEAVDTQGNAVGRLTDVLTPNSVCDVYVFSTPRGEMMMPALRRVVKEVDLTAGRMLLDAQALAEVAVWEDESAPQDDD